MEAPVLTDGVVTVRRRVAADVPAIAAAAGDPETERWLEAAPSAADLADVAGSLRRVEEAWAAGRTAPFTVADAATDAALGLVNVQVRDGRVATLAYSVFPSARGRGVAVRAVGLVAPWALAAFGLEELRLEIDPGNTASTRVADKLGWRLLDERTADGQVVYATGPTS